MISIATALENLSKSYPEIFQLITQFAYLSGIAFTIIAIFKLKSYAESSTMGSSGGGLKAPMIYLIIGAIFLFLPTLMDSLMTTLWGYSSVINPMSYVAVGSLSSATNIAVFGLIKIIGLISFIRGWFLLSQLANQPQPGIVSKAIAHIIGGLLAMNIENTIDMLEATFGM